MHKLRHDGKQGFTIVELLIAIVVVGILATISVTVYAGIQNQANDSTVKSDLRTIEQNIEMFKVENGAYPLVGDLSKLGFRASRDSYDKTYYNFHYCVRATDREAYSIQARSKSKNTFYINSISKKTLNKATPYWEDNCATIGYLGGGSSVGFGAQYGYNFGDNTWQPWL